MSSSGRLSRSAGPRALVGHLGLLLAVGCSGDDASTPEGSTGVSGEIVVFAAASLTEAFTVEHPSASVTFNFAASSELVAQIVEGVPADVFASADPANMDRLAEAGAAADEPVVVATNRSQIIVAPGNPLGITGVADLTDDELVLVTCAPQVPCGSYAAQIFENAGVAPTSDSYEESVKAVVTKVVLGEADAGIAYATDVIAAGDDADGVEIPAAVNVVAEYPIAPTTESTNPIGGQAFVEFVLGAAGQVILAEHGFSPS
ncbi:MAG: molybdate ABC transporter substrate-binding protein [Acidimicrobiia bacterium]